MKDLYTKADSIATAINSAYGKRTWTKYTAKRAVSAINITVDGNKAPFGELLRATMTTNYRICIIL